jgi:D-tyrosyl-tRNA(Tyr) deacylase
VISNFTLHGRNKKGTQIDFSQAATYDQAKLIYDDLITALRDQQIDLITGEFGAKMQIDCQLDGPVNLILDY